MNTRKLYEPEKPLSEDPSFDPKERFAHILEVGLDQCVDDAWFES